MVEKKFIILHKKDSTSIIQIECCKIHSFPWEVKEGEYRYLLLGTGSENLYQDVWYSWALYDTPDEAMFAAVSDIRSDLKRKYLKANIHIADSDMEKELEKKSSLIKFNFIEEK